MSSDDRPGTGAGPERHVGLAQDLAGRTDEQLVELLLARPDLATPPPTSTAVLAQRALAGPSISLAAEDLDLLAAAVIEQAITATTDAAHRTILAPTSAKAVLSALAGRADKDDIRERIALLRSRALLWGPDSALETGSHTPSALSTRAMHLNGPLSTMTLAEIADVLAGLSDRERELIETLATGSALGRTRDAAPDADPARPVPHLISLGLLARVDDQTVELPPVLGQLLRGEKPAEPNDLRAPALVPADTTRKFKAADVEAAAGGEALELLRHLTDTVEVLGRSPALVLRAGGLGVREMRRLSKATGIDIVRQGFVIELLAGARLIDNGFPDPPIDSGETAWTPTVTADQWLHQPPERRWYAIADAWMTLPRRPWQIGEDSAEGSAIPSLAGDLYDVQAPVERRMLLSALATGTSGVSVDVDSLARLIGWRHPRWQRRMSRRLIDATLEEARSLGLVAHGALTAAGRAIIADPATQNGDPEKAVSTVMGRALPDPIDFFLTQADLTVTAPGPLTPELSAELALVADLESGGAASVYRVTDSTVRRALDTGRTGTELTGFFTAHSKTPVPQSLEYLIDDVARRHGQLRVGVASAFIRCEDPTTLAAVLASPVAETLALRALAPTVAISQASLKTVLDELRAAGFAPAGEDSSGDLVDLRERGARVPALRAVRRSPRRPVASPEQMTTVVSRMRTQDAAVSAVPSGATGNSVRAGGGEPATALLQLAMRVGRKVRIGYVDAHGSASRHIVVPRLVGAGQLIVTEDDGLSDQHYALHRITSVELIEE
ncbi:helicase-associated domain-containing protein [Williamsia phyllosphaerae]|uniref:DNA-binding protein n=1 Tax=Williamsia phyllosphaerae TaxID=885042 RepID=A0ABQ1V432_9NOCA|nr:helicase-associated domain-containing protein [Williamsia phyllosphaerae]GGF36414.1 DNA-binding protein [Williamsia phyllosphaerae]